MYAITHVDLGTPAPGVGELVTLAIDGVSVSVPAGSSVMRAAAAASGNSDALVESAQAP